jgi:hypothetical protein
MLSNIDKKSVARVIVQETRRGEKMSVLEKEGREIKLFAPRKIK